jgi:hypothetical protein
MCSYYSYYSYYVPSHEYGVGVSAEECLRPLDCAVPTVPSSDEAV